MRIVTRTMAVVLVAFLGVRLPILGFIWKKVQFIPLTPLLFLIVFVDFLSLIINLVFLKERLVRKRLRVHRGSSVDASVRAWVSHTMLSAYYIAVGIFPEIVFLYPFECWWDWLKG